MKRMLWLAVLGLCGGAAAEPLVALTSGNALLRFDSATPGTVDVVLISGLAGGEFLTGIDARPADGLLYGISSAGNLYEINADTGAVTFRIAMTGGMIPGTRFGMDFNPQVDRLRLVSDTGANQRLNFYTGAALPDAGLNFAGGDPNAGDMPSVGAAAYTNNFAGTPVTGLFCVDAGNDVLAIVNPPNNGVVTTIGALGVDATTDMGMDFGRFGTMYAAIDPGGAGAANLYTIDTTFGFATMVGQIGAGFTVVGLAVLNIATDPVGNEAIIGLAADGQLVKFRAAAPDIILDTIPVTGMVLGEALMGIDVRPSTMQLYGITSLDQLYIIDPLSGAATLVGVTDTALTGTRYAMDFNPAADRLRIITDSTQNLRVNPVSAATIVDTPTVYATGDINQFNTPSITAAAYDNSTSTLYVIDTNIDKLAMTTQANNGAFNTVTGITIGTTSGPESGLDISVRSDEAYAVLSSRLDGGSVFYTMDLATGTIVLVKSVGLALPLQDIAVAGVWHSADQDLDGSIELSELLRAIQFFNSGGLSCPDRLIDTEDSYRAGVGGNQMCLPHDSDYVTQDWVISLSELLALVQLYNAGTYQRCPGEVGDDGFCISG